MSETTIFPVRIGGVIHAAFVLDESTDKWATQCGKSVRDGSKVQHAVTVVECQACADNIHRARLHRMR